MPPRGTASLWPVRILTDFGKDGLCAVVAGRRCCLRLRSLRRPCREPRGARLLASVASAVSVSRGAGAALAGEFVKWIVGRGRPFVGGNANAFNFAPFAGNRGLCQLSIGACHHGLCAGFRGCRALAAMRGSVMIAYALLIAASRLVLLAHHPSDVVAGALIGVIGAMGVRYWFAARGLGFAIGTMAVLRRSPGPRGAPQRGCPRERQPHKKRTRRQPAARPTQTRVRFAFFRHSRRRRFHRCSRAQRSRECRPADRRNRSGARRPMGLRNHLRQ